MTIADDYVQKMIDADPDVSNVTQLANAHAYNNEFLRGMRACAQGDPYDTSKGDSWQVGWKSGQALGLYDVWP